jgi:hypothetical protein
MNKKLNLKKKLSQKTIIPIFIRPAILFEAHFEETSIRPTDKLEHDKALAADAAMRGK